ncbi:MAG: hypothetical protein E7571_00240 [Ruminococcaceae bacterium]|nr:hypothetical protein [Oscillospiraceae bacterium]
MAHITGFESLEKIKKIYPCFDLTTRKFSNIKGTKFHGGIPLLYDSETKRLYIDASDTHSLVYGSTGSLKTRAIVSPGIKVLGYAGESMIINDPKGELFARHAGDLKKQGYNIVEINFRDPSVGNSWNPLYIPYQFYINGDIDKSAEFINDISNNLMVSDRSTDDPFWDFSASDLLYGLIQLLFRYCKDHDAPINAVNIGNLIALRRALFSGKQQAQNTVLWKYASEDELVAASLSGSVYAPRDTMNSILSVFDQKMRSFTIQPTLLDMLANNDFDIAGIGKTKTAVFLITPDEKTSYHRLVSMFVKESYEYLIYLATQTEDNKVENRINYILDEFSSLPQIADMPSMISAARSRDIRFLLVVQSQSSLKQRYSEEAETIISNCTNWIFFTSRELSLLKEISELCGTQKNQMPNISVYDLQHLNKERREALILSGRLKPAKVNMLDIDKFGDRTYTLLSHEHRERLNREKLTFELREDIKSKYISQMPTNPFLDGNPFSSMSTDDLHENTSKPKNSDVEVDDILKRIDQRIAELEKEEAEEQEGKDSPDTTDSPESNNDKKGE